MNDIVKRISEIGIIPEFKFKDEKKDASVAKALAKGGIPIAEITFRDSAAEESIRHISAECPDIMLGAGTVLTCEQVDRAVNAGAKFITTPGFNPTVTAHCVNWGIPIIPGCSNPSDIERALELGIDTVKMFPAEHLGGVEYIKALSGSYGSVNFIPTGGININNLAEYLTFPKVAACGGSWAVPSALVEADDFVAIEMIARETVKAVLGFGLAHVGINCESIEEAGASAKILCGLFGFDYLPGANSVFAGTVGEFMKPPYRGTNGHIGIKTNSVIRAMASLAAKGIRFVDSTRRYTESGSLRFIYLEDELCGFALHLTQK